MIKQLIQQVLKMYLAHSKLSVVIIFVPSRLKELGEWQ